jgi:hypothetical protein
MDMRAVAVSLAAWVLGACQLEVSYEGARFTCLEPEDSCPTGTVCTDGECLPGGGGVPDAAPAVDAVELPDPVDAAPDATPGTPDAAPPEFTLITVTLGERPGADFQDVSRDTYITAEFPNSSQSGGSELATDSNPQQSALMRWDLTRLPAGAEVVSAELAVFVYDPLENGDFVAYPLTESFVERATFFNRLRDPDVGWTTPGAGLGSRSATPMASFAPRTVGEYRVNLAAPVVQTWLADVNQNFGMVWVTHSNVVDGRGGEWSSSDEGTTSQRPELTLVLRVPN